MPATIAQGDKKKALLAYKEKLLLDLKYYEERINDARGSLKNSSYFEDDASSDSDTELCINESGRSITQLKTEQGMLRTCLQATQELTGLEVLQSEVNVMVQEPDIRGEPAVREAGTWREVTAECCVDLVPFSITFYAHKAHRSFAPTLYRGLRVSPLKSAHEAELLKSVLPGLKRPSDAVEVLRSYAVAYRSRRSTLARLADKFGAELFMEPIAEGGYVLKCANLLEVSWGLQNKWSPIAPFHHRMKFDIEYMDESYIKTITQAHRQLSDPAVDTDERTLLLAKIIGTCLDAAPRKDEEGGTEESGGERGRTTLDREPDGPGRRVRKDSEVMAPPKAVPKKTRPRSNENSADVRKPEQKPIKRSIQGDSNNENTKKIKTNDAQSTSNKTDGKETKNTEAGDRKREKSTKSVASDKNVVQDKVAFSKNKEKQNSADKGVSSSKNDEKSKGDDNGVARAKNPESIDSNDKGNVTATNKNDTEVDFVKRKDGEKKDKNRASKNQSQKSVTSAKSNTDTSSKTASVASNKNTKDANKRAQGTEKDTHAKTTENVTKKTAKGSEEVKKNVTKKTNDNNEKQNTEKVNVATEKKETTTHNSDKLKTIEKPASVAKKPTNTKKPLSEQANKIAKPSVENKKPDAKLPKPKSVPTKMPTNLKKVPQTGNTEKENKTEAKGSKIPQKKVVTPKGVFKKMPSRMSPRNPLAKSKPLVGKTVIQKTVTGIPRLMTKPKPKVTS